MNQMTAMGSSFFYKSAKNMGWKRNGTGKKKGTGKIAYPPTEK